MVNVVDIMDKKWVGGSPFLLKRKQQTLRIGIHYHENRRAETLNNNKNMIINRTMFKDLSLFIEGEKKISPQ